MDKSVVLKVCATIFSGVRNDDDDDNDVDVNKQGTRIMGKKCDNADCRSVFAFWQQQHIALS